MEIKIYYLSNAYLKSNNYKQLMKKLKECVKNETNV